MSPVVQMRNLNINPSLKDSCNCCVGESQEACCEIDCSILCCFPKKPKVKETDIKIERVAKESVNHGTPKKKPRL